MGGTHSPHVVLPSQKPLGLAPHPQYPPQYIPGVQNVEADRDSRVFQDSSDWKLNPMVFDRLYHKGAPLDIDLFASRLSFQLDQFVSWRRDPLAVRTDAFT